MKLSWTGVFALILLVAGSVLRLLNIGETSFWAIRIVPALLSLLMIIVSMSVWKALSKRKASERWPWMWFTFAAFANFFAMVFEALPKILPNPDTTISMISSGFFLVAYVCFIIGFWLESMQVEWVSSKFNVWVPLLVNIVGFGVITFFLLKELSAANMAGIWSVTFVSFVAMDFILIGVIWAVVARTRGGKLSIPYLTIGIGCLVLVIFHIIASFLLTKGMFDVDNVFRTLLMIALAVIVVGGDLRLGIEKQLE
jgi:hypothetical protein